jgi:hypothetical protein
MVANATAWEQLSGARRNRSGAGPVHAGNPLDSPREHASDVRIHHARRLTEGEGPYSRGRVRSNAGQRTQTGLRSWEAAATLFSDNARCTLEIYCAPVVAKSTPCRDDVSGGGV